MLVAADEATGGETFDLVMGELDEAGCFIAVRVVHEGLSHEQGVTALDLERSTQCQLAGRSIQVTASHGDSFELLDAKGHSYRRFFLERTA